MPTGGDSTAGGRTAAAGSGPPAPPPPVSPPPDNVVLVRRCRSGDQTAWAQLVRRYENLVYSVALRTGLSEDEADDVFQQVWLELFRSLHRLQNPQALPRWLMVSTRRLCYKQVARSTRTANAVSEDLIDPALLPDEEVERFEQRLLVEEALERLDANCAGLLRLLFLDDRRPSYKDISRKTGLAVGSIGPIRARCIERMKHFMRSNP